MKNWQSNISFILAATVVGIISILVTPPAWAQAKLENPEQLSLKGVENLNQQLKAQFDSLTTRVKQGKKVQVLQTDAGEQKIRQLSDFKIPITNAQPLLIQTLSQGKKQGSSVIPITSVKANPTPKGVEVILETPVGTHLQVTNRSIGNNFIVDVSGGQLQLPNGEAFTFRSDKPLVGITQITAQNIDTNTVRVTVVGEKALPIVELYDDDAGLVFAVATTATATSPQQLPQTPQAIQPQNQTQPTQPSAGGNEPIELVVTGEQDGYRATDGSTATKTDTPLRDIPQSIQVLPRQVLQDQQVTTNLAEALKNVPGVVQTSNSSSRGQYQVPSIRGFGGNLLRDGLVDQTSNIVGFDAAGIERIEVLKGPAGVLYGQGGYGGSINIVTKKPLRDPYYSAEFSAGSYNFYRGAIDLSGPLNDSKTVLYRLNAAAQTTESFLDFYDGQQYYVAPSLTWLLSDRTKLNLIAEYIDRPKAFGQTGIPAVGSILPNPNGKVPRSRNTSEPSSTDNSSTIRIGYDLEHRFSSNWQLRNTFSAWWNRQDRDFVIGYSLNDDNRTVERLYNKPRVNAQVFNVDTYVIGKFTTGSIQHQLVTGFNYSTYNNDTTDNRRQAEPLDLFNPVYGRPRPLGASTGQSSAYFNGDDYGFYVQDQITLVENLKLLLGGRFDIENENLNSIFASSPRSSTQNQAFSPRVGIVYQPIRAISLYASYSRTFAGNQSVFGETPIEPNYGTQYEVGVKADLSDRLSATLSFYDLTQSNVVGEDPNRPGFSISLGGVETRGIEFELSGEILPGWNIIGGYAFTNAEFTDGTDSILSNSLYNVPKHSFNLWTTYEIQSGSLQGLGLGVGLYYVGERPGDNDNTFELPSYFRTDASIFYKRNGFRAAINFKNLFDVDYFESSASRTNVFPGEPFVVQGTVSWQF